MTAINQAERQEILIVDDTTANVLLLERMLTERGYKTRSVASGPLALEAVRHAVPDLILLDINMPGMNGYEVCRQLKANTETQDVPVIFISALHEVLEKVMAFNAGGVDFITKPFQFEEVFARIKTHLQLRWLERLRNDLTHMIIHDLRNPLTVIFGLLDLLGYQEERNHNDQTHELIAVARRSAEEMLTMISSILDVSKMGAGEMKLQREVFALDVLINTVLSTTRPVSENRTVTFATSTLSVSVSADVVLIRRVLQNLLNNALKYTVAGGDVLMAMLPTGDDVRITVRDNGPGIAPENHLRIFEKFGQVGNGVSRLGTGLGLTFCKLAVEAHGGHIGVESALGSGSTFWLSLPREKAVSPAHQDAHVLHETVAVV